MRHSFLTFAAALVLFSARCAIGQADPAASTAHGVESLYTSLNAHSCKDVVDESDPNSLTYQVCPGVAGYHLQVRPIESGRVSINIVTPAKRRIDLNYGVVITHSMDGVDEKAEWRVRRDGGKVVPLALIVRVLVHGNIRTPEKVTQVYWAVAKITAGKACVTDRVLEGAKPAAEVRALADSAADRPCAARLR